MQTKLFISLCCGVIHLPRPTEPDASSSDKCSPARMTQRRLWGRMLKMLLWTFLRKPFSGVSAMAGWVVRMVDIPIGCSARAANEFPSGIQELRHWV